MKSSNYMKVTQTIENKILFFAPVVLLVIFCLQTYRPLIRMFGISELSISMSFFVFSILAVVNIFISYTSQYLIKNKGSASIFSLMLCWVALYYGYFIKFLKSITGDFLLNTFFSISFQKILIVSLFIGFFLILKFYKNDLRAFGLFVSYCCIFFLATEMYITFKDLINDKKVKIDKPNFIVNNNKNNIQPDIYFFVVDAYTSNSSLEKLNFSNAEFENTLQKSGFFIAEKSKANYPITYPSLASTFNLNYTDLNVDELISYNQKKMLDNYIQNNLLFDFLLKENYKVITLSHLFNNGMVHQLNTRDRSYYYWEITKGSIYYPFIYKSLDMLSNLKDSKLKSLMDYYNYSVKLPIVLDSVVNNTIGPKFVYAHFMVTHPPYVFNTDGTFKYHYNDQASVSEYIDQVKILNRQLTTIIDSILKRNVSNSVIIVQADHGSHLLNVNETFTIQNNYYFPDLDYTLLNQNTSPVNSFRIILNKYFGQQLPLLKDKSIRVNY